MNLGEISLLFLSGCLEVSQKEFSAKAYFSIDSLLNQQTYLSSGSITIKKQVSMDKQEETKLLVLDSTEWLDELSVLRDIDLNKSDLVGAYEIRNEGSKIFYEKKSSVGAGSVQWLTVDKKSDGLLIDALMAEKNSIYYTERSFKIDFDDQGILQQYQIKGLQKMVLKDTTKFTVKVEVQ